VRERGPARSQAQPQGQLARHGGNDGDKQGVSHYVSQIAAHRGTNGPAGAPNKRQPLAKPQQAKATVVAAEFNSVTDVQCRTQLAEHPQRFSPAQPTRHRKVNVRHLPGVLRTSRRPCRSGGSIVSVSYWHPLIACLIARLGRPGKRSASHNLSRGPEFRAVFGRDDEVPAYKMSRSQGSVASLCAI